MSQVIVVRDFKKHDYVFAFGAADVSIEADINPELGIKGEVVKIIVTIPNWTNAVTAVVSMNNTDSKEIFADDPRDRDDEYAVTLDRHECIILGQVNEKWIITLSGVPGGTGGSVNLTAYVRG